MTHLTFALLATLASPIAPAIGDKAGEFTIKDIRFVPKGLADFGPKKAYVLAFLDVHCPVAAKYAPRLEHLWKRYEKRDVVFIGIDASPGDTCVELAAWALDKRLTFPVHKDFEQTALRAVGATRTPEVVVLDAKGVIRYRGRIDDQFRISGSAPGARRAYLRGAIDAVLEGKNPEPAETPVDGCFITSRQLPKRDGVTYSEHIAPIVQKHCQPCHRPNQAAPFSLLTYGDARKQAAMIAEVVEERRMPPAFADPRYGRFVNHRVLDEEEIELVLSWANGDRARGDPSKAPAPIDWPEGEWGIDTPDVVLESPEEFEIPATGYVDYKYVELEHEFPHDTWINQIQILPGNRRVVHHANLYAETILGVPMFLTGHVPGGDVTRYGKNAGVMIPRGSKLRLQIHYTTTGEVERDRTRVGLVFAKEPIHRQVRILFIVNKSFSIPPHDPFYQVSEKRTFPMDVIGEALFIHMHLRGRDMAFRATYPDGSTEMLLNVPNYSFDWQLAYRWKPGTKRFPKGTTIETVSHYDNSIYNPFNPDPNETVREGRQSYHEMNYGFVFFFHADEKLDIKVDPETGKAL